MHEQRAALRTLLLDAGLELEVVDRLQPGTPLRAQGVDSIDHAAILLAIQDNYGITVSDEASLQLLTLEDFAALLPEGTSGDHSRAASERKE